MFVEDQAGQHTLKLMPGLCQVQLVPDQFATDQYVVAEIDWASTLTECCCFGQSAAHLL